jgi:hypothetical protein
MFPLPPVIGDLDIQAQKHVRHDGRMARLIENANVGRREKRTPFPRASPCTIQRLGQQSLLFL